MHEGGSSVQDEEIGMTIHVGGLDIVLRVYNYMG